MRKVWIIGGVAIVALIAVAAWAPRPASSTQGLLATAQSEFAGKAREEVMQRQKAFQDPTESVAARLPQPAAPMQPPILDVASLNPVAPPVASVPEAPLTSLGPTNAVTGQAEPARIPAASSGSANIATSPSEPVGSPAGPKQVDPVLLPSAAAAPAQPAEPATIATVTTRPVIKQLTPATAASTSHATIGAKRLTSNKPGRAGHRSKPDISSVALPRDFEELRARAPEIATMIARYM